MNTENDTNEEVDYEQTGGAPPLDRSRCRGRLPPGGRATFAPCGPPKWVVVFTDASGSKHSSRRLEASEAGATVRLEGPGRVVVLP